jgi:LysM repeat protein
MNGLDKKDFFVIIILQFMIREKERRERKRREKRLCKACGAEVAKKAKTCLMCGAPLKRQEQSDFVPDLMLLFVIASLAALWLLKPWQRGEPQSALPSPTPTATLRVPKERDSQIQRIQSNVESILPYDKSVLSEIQATSGKKVTLGPTATSYTATIPSTSTPTSTPTPIPIVHIVLPGESLISIAEKYGTTVNAITEANDISESEIIRVGQELIIPQTSPTVEVAAPFTEIITHVVEEGESLSSIAVEYGVEVSAIMEANQIANPELIRVGELLVVPFGTPKPSPTATPQPTLTPTPGPLYPPPPLLNPMDGEVFKGDAVIILNWASVGILADDEWYLVRLHYIAEGEARVLTIWTKATSLKVPEELRPIDSSHQRAISLQSKSLQKELRRTPEAEIHLFKWDVTVMRRTGTKPDGEWEGEAISPVSTTREFYWY